MSEESQEISSLDFSNLIGGPLNAIVEAQAKSAIATADFIKQVGFKLDSEGNIEGVNYANFQFARKDENGRSQDFKLSVPFLTMIPIPYITVDEGNIEFNAKITSVRESKMDDSWKVDQQSEVKAGFWFARAKVSTQTSYQQNTSETGKVERSYDMNVKVKVRNADMPRGTERILDILQEVIEEVPVTPVKAISGVVSAIDDKNKKQLTLSTVDKMNVDWVLKINDTEVGKIKNVDPINKLVTLDKDVEKIKIGYQFEARANGVAPRKDSPSGNLTTAQISEILKEEGENNAEKIANIKGRIDAQNYTKEQLQQIKDATDQIAAKGVKDDINKYLDDKLK